MPRRFFLSNGFLWFHTYEDLGFRNKWCGLWKKNQKLLEFLAFKIGDNWLSPENFKKIEYSPYQTIHHFETKDGSAKIKFFLPEKISAIKIEVESKALASLPLYVEMGVNFRRWNENWHTRTYQKKVDQNYLEINGQTNSIIVFSSNKFEVLNNERYTDHYPSGEKQRYYMPGWIKFNLTEKKNKVSFVISTTKENIDVNEDATVEEWKNIKSLVETPVKWLNELFDVSAENVKKCFFYPGFFAGLPWYVQYWGRDSAWIVDAAVDLGLFDEAKRALKLLANKQSSEGKIPNLIDGENIDYNSSDSTPLWIISLSKYIYTSGDIFTLFDLKENIISAFNYLLSVWDDKKVVKSEPHSTWCDTLKRGTHVIELQAIWYRALRELSKMFILLDKPLLKKEADDLSFHLAFSIEKLFKKDGIYVDNLEFPYESVNQIFVSLFFDDRPEILKRLESKDFTRHFGLSTLSAKEKDFEASSYHKGASWGIINGLMALLEFKQGRFLNGLDYLKIIKNVSEKYTINSLLEAWNCDTGEILLKKPVGMEESSLLQGWTASSVIKAVEEGIFGIRTDAFTKTIYISPTIDEGVYKIKKRIGNDWIELELEKKGARIVPKLKSYRNIKYKIILVPKI